MEELVRLVKIMVLLLMHHIVLLIIANDIVDQITSRITMQFEDTVGEHHDDK